MWTALTVLLVGAALAAGAAFWVLRAYRRAGGGARSGRLALVACVMTALAALVIYLAIGRPELPDAPYAVRVAALMNASDPSAFTADEALAVLRERAHMDSADPLPHFYSGQLLLGQGRDREAARAFDAALRRDPQLADAKMGLARALVGIDEGRIGDDALALFQEVGALTNDPAPWIYQALAAVQNNRREDAARLWNEALLRMGPDDPRREMVRTMIAETGRDQ